MPRPKKDFRPCSIKMEVETFDRLQNYCEKSGQPKTVAIERAVNMFIDDYDHKMAQLLDQTTTNKNSVCDTQSD